jgi:hypothetical protein
MTEIAIIVSQTKDAQIATATWEFNDNDKDGLSNLQEIQLNTLPDKRDTDEDGLDDGDEVGRKTNPLKPDTDEDGIKDGDEVGKGLNPLDKDTDQDGKDDAVDNDPGKVDTSTPSPSPSPSATPQPSGTATIQPTGTYTPTPTQTATGTLLPSDTPTWTPTVYHFAITNLTASVDIPSYDGACPVTFNFSAAITSNGPGTITYRWERSDSAQAPENSLTFDSASTQNVNTQWHLGAPGTHWQALHILSPVDLVSNQATFTLNCIAQPQTIIFDTFPDNTLINSDIILEGGEFEAAHDIGVFGAPESSYCSDATVAAIRMAGTYGVPFNFLTTARPSAINECNGIPVEIKFYQNASSVTLSYYGASVTYTMNVYDGSGTLIGVVNKDTILGNSTTISFTSGSSNISYLTFGYQTAITAVYQIYYEP